MWDAINGLFNFLQSEGSLQMIKLANRNAANPQFKLEEHFTSTVISSTQNENQIVVRSPQLVAVLWPDWFCYWLSMMKYYDFLIKYSQCG